MGMQQLVVISGCSGGGKSALLEELRQRGHASVDEPGRRIITKQMRQGGDALPWADMGAFLHEALQVARLDIERVALATGPVFFDRGLVDAAAALQRLFGVPMSQTLGDFRPYGLLVLLAPPWPEIYRSDEQRRHGLEEAVAEYTHLETTYNDLGYDVMLLPKASVVDRADFVLETLDRG